MVLVPALAGAVAASTGDGRAGTSVPHPAWRDRAATLHRALEVRHPDTGAHCLRTGRLAAFLAPALGVDPDRAELAGRLHDLGKLALPDAILLGRDRLTDAQYLRVKLHPIHGRALARSLALPEWLVQGIAAHHERWDGRGYPAGLAAEAVHPVARVVSVADAIDAICSRRTYKPARPPAAAFEALEGNRATQFDPVVVDHALAHREELTRLILLLQGRVRPREGLAAP